MTLGDIEDVERLKRINEALIARVESAMDQHGNAFSLFQTAINLEGQVRRRTEELTSTLRSLERTNLELAAAKEASEIANLSKTKFLAAASHDVLQPLHAAQLSISSLADLQTTEQARTLVRQVERSLETMSELLRTLLDISRLDAGVMPPQMETLRLGPVLDDLRSAFAPIAEEKGLELRFRSHNLTVRSDKTMLLRVLQNLVSNGLRYTERGGVLVAVRPRHRTVDLDIVDTGCGIRSDQYDLIFEEFHRGVVPASGSNGAQAGLGLGLSIVKRMASALNHDLSFSSREDRGTRFRLSLPRVTNPTFDRRRSALTIQADADGGLTDAKVLLIENDPAVQDAMATLLDSWRCDVRTAATTAAALSALNGTAWIPDIVIADQHLDHGDLGTVTIDNIRGMLGKPVPAIIVTADPSQIVQTLAERAHVDVMRKPLKPAQLRALMSHLLLHAHA